MQMDGYLNTQTHSHHNNHLYGSHSCLSVSLSVYMSVCFCDRSKRPLQKLTNISFRSLSKLQRITWVRKYHLTITIEGFIMIESTGAAFWLCRAFVLVTEKVKGQKLINKISTF